MSAAGKFAAVVLGILLTTTLGLSLTVATAHQTVLDPDFVANGIEEEGGYDLVLEQVAAAAGSGGTTASGTTANGTTTDAGDGGSDQSGPIDRQALLQRAIDEAYLENQTERNVDRLYAYLHGNREQVNLSIDLRPAKANAAEAVEAEIQNASLAELASTSGASLPGPVDADLLARLTANESSYRAAKADFRASLRERVIDETADRLYESRDEDELLALVIEDYDPNDHSESEKRRIVADREAEIKTALREQIRAERGDEIDARVDDRLDRLRNSTANATGDTELQTAALELQTVLLRGLTTDQSYDAFRSDLDAAKADLATLVGDQAAATLNEQTPDRIDLTQNVGEGATQALASARTGVVWLDRLAIALPVVVGVLVGLIYWLKGSLLGVSWTLGSTMVWTGLPTYLLLGFASTQLERRAAAMATDPQQRQVTAFVVDVFQRILGTVGALSLTLTVAGAVLVGVALAGKYGALETVLDAVRERFEGGTGEGSE